MSCVLHWAAPLFDKQMKLLSESNTIGTNILYQTQQREVCWAATIFAS